MGSTHFSFLLLFCVFHVHDIECRLIDCLDRDIEVAKQHLDVLIPTLRENKTAGEAGIIGVIGGSIDSTGPPYLAAITALRTGADLLLVVTTREAAPVIMKLSADLYVYPYLSYKSSSLLKQIISHMDVVVAGAGIGRSEESMTLLYYIIRTCKLLKKPLIIDGDGHYMISREPTIISDYPSPGCILTPSQISTHRFENVLGNKTHWHNSWGYYVSVLIKGDRDRFYSPIAAYSWSIVDVDSGRSAAGQGDVLVGFLATIYNWNLKKNPFCSTANQVQMFQSIAAYAAVKLLKKCSAKTFLVHGRSMIASDMIGRIHSAFEEVFHVTK